MLNKDPCRAIIKDFLKNKSKTSSVQNLGNISLPIIITSLRLNVLLSVFNDKDYSAVKRHSLRSSLTLKTENKPKAT